MNFQTWTIDGVDTEIKSSDTSIKWEDDTFFTLNYKGESFNGEIIEEDTENNFLKLKINHRVFNIRKKGKLDALISEMGLDKPKVKKLKELEAPMPGRIVNIEVKIGQQLNVGDNLLSLEAMKMENVLKAEGTGKVKSINYSNNDVVEKGAIIIEFE